MMPVQVWVERLGIPNQRMNDESKKLQHRLEQATSPDCPAEALADTELAAWRESWLALGQMLEDREKQARPMAIALPGQLADPAAAPASPRKVSLFSMAVAASLLVAAAMFGLHRAKQLFHESDSPENSSQRIARHIDLRWNDNWDARISILSTRLALVQYEGDGWTTEYLRLHTRANALERELDGNSF
jgi:hypothetical protein